MLECQWDNGLIIKWTLFSNSEMRSNKMVLKKNKNLNNITKHATERFNGSLRLHNRRDGGDKQKGKEEKKINQKTEDKNE